MGANNQGRNEASSMGNTSGMTQQRNLSILGEEENPLQQIPKAPLWSKRFSFFVDFKCNFKEHPVLSKVAEHLPFEANIEVTDKHQRVEACL